MTLRLLALPLLATLGLSPAIAGEKAGTTSAYVGRVDPSAFHPTPLEHKKLGVVVDPAAVRMITPGVDKFTVYRLIGTPHFDEGITRRWNYVLFFPFLAARVSRSRQPQL